MSIHRIEWLEQTGSTNTDLRQRLDGAEDSAEHLVLATGRQTAGRGRAGRTWSEGGGDNLCFSFFVATRVAPNRVPSLGMAACLGVDDGLRAIGIESHPKWPNDVRVGASKICGILCETYSGHGRRGAIVGIGINVNMDSSEARRIDQPATSTLIESGKKMSPLKLLQTLLPSIDLRVQDWLDSGFKALREDFICRCVDIGRAVEVRDGCQLRRGTLLGFGDSGECILELADGSTEAVWSGDIQTRFSGSFR